MNGLLSKIVIAQNTCAILFCAAKAIAKPQIQAQAIIAFTLYPRLLKIVIKPKTHIITINIFSMNGSKVLASGSNFNFGFFIILYLNKLPTSDVIEIIRTIIIPIEYTFTKKL
ncbi:MAG: hypothetical protein LBD88_03590 [Candidatus Peribacteria bacterium]|nr:hypothetical protein [Candidatus Peribacteria bacterium]